MQKKNISIVTANMLCTGCAACTNSCHKGALKLAKDSLGTLVPIVEESICIDCGLCLKSCPGIDVDGTCIAETTSDPFVGNVISTYVGKSTNEAIYQNSQSGGAVTSFLYFLFDERLIDCAIVVSQINALPQYCVVTNKNQLASTQKSQYITVNLLSGLIELDNYNEVAIVGLPCHIEGLKKLSALNDCNAKKIKYKLGLICGGTFPPIMSEIVTGLGKINNTQNARIIWRSKASGCYNNALLELADNKSNTSYFLPRELRHQAKHLLTPPRCRLCFDKLNSSADIVFGDPWGMKEIDKKKGNSLFFSRTDVGEQLLKDVIRKGYVTAVEANFNEVLSGQGIDNKKSYVQESINVYRSQGWVLPGWSAKLNIATKKRHPELSKEIREFRKYYVIGRKKAYNSLSKHMRAVMFKIKVKSFIHKLFK